MRYVHKFRQFLRTHPFFVYLRDIHHQLLAYQALLGYVPEEPRLYAYLSAVEYLQLVGGLRDLVRSLVLSARSTARRAS